ncbi:MAG: hypothetical protein IJ512_07515 [Ruminococcus sp.]|nr:hypothetical protein [Ruminococcus sp.]
MVNSIFTIGELKESYRAVQRLLEQLQEDHSYMQKALDYLERMPSQQVPGDIAGQAKATAAMEIVRSREKTNQQLLAVYDKMYEDLRSVIFQSDVQDTPEEI